MWGNNCPGRTRGASESLVLGIRLDACRRQSGRFLACVQGAAIKCTESEIPLVHAWCDENRESDTDSGKPMRVIQVVEAAICPGVFGGNSEELLGMFCVSKGDVRKEISMVLHLASVGWEEAKYRCLVSATGSQMLRGVDVHGIEPNTERRHCDR